MPKTPKAKPKTVKFKFQYGTVEAEVTWDPSKADGVHEGPDRITISMGPDATEGMYHITHKILQAEIDREVDTSAN